MVRDELQVTPAIDGQPRGYNQLVHGSFAEQEPVIDGVLGRGGVVVTVVLGQLQPLQ
jgi:hypothetical protein